MFLSRKSSRLILDKSVIVKVLFVNVAVNAMNQLAAFKAQQRMMDPRLQPLRAVIPTVSHAGPISPLSPRSSMQSAPPISSGVTGLKYPPGTLPIFSQASKPGKHTLCFFRLIKECGFVFKETI
jgi:hypothetical protein